MQTARKGFVAFQNRKYKFQQTILFLFQLLSQYIQYFDVQHINTRMSKGLSDLFNAPNSTEADLASSVQFNNPTSRRSEMNLSQQKRKPEESMEMDRVFCH